MKLAFATAVGVAAAGYATAQPEFYAAVGYTAVDASDIDILNTGVIRAGVNAIPNIGVEVEYSRSLGSTDFFGGDLELDNQAAAYVVGRLPVTEKLEVFGRAGYGVIELSAEIGGFSASDSVDAFSFGAGAEFDITDNVALRADYTRFEADDSEIDGGINAFGISVVIST
ncbi:MAG: porin family protein [Pseudomonadota bacterium]